MARLRVSPEELIEKLEKIFASAEFARSGQMVRLLKFLVEHAVESGPEPLSERLIAEKVFHRHLPDYDPKLDPIVRTQARRLRSKLASYYERAGSRDTVRIAIPKGGYVPEVEFLEPRPATPPPAPVPSPERAAPSPPTHWGVIVLIVLPIVCVLTYLVAIRRGGREIAAARTYEILPFANEIGREFSPAISPDGTKIAYVWDGDGENFDVYVQSTDRRSRYRLTEDPAQDLYPAWSPDGKWIAFLRSSADGTVVIVKPSSGGKERVITQIRTESANWATDLGAGIGNSGPSWSSDGAHLAVSDWCGPGQGYGIYLVSIDTLERRRLTTPAAVNRDLYPRISPDRKSLAFVRYATHGVGELYVQALAEERPTQLTFDRHVVRGVAWMPDSRGLIFASNRARDYQLWQLRLPKGQPMVLPTNTSSANDPAVGPGGNWLAFVDETQNWTIWRAHLVDGKVTGSERFLSSSGRNHTARYSPDGAQVAFVSDRSGSWEIWVCDSAGAHTRQLTHFNGPWLGGLNWSPDGKLLAFDARVNGHSAVLQIDADGKNLLALEANEFENRMPGFSKDGRYLYFNSDRNGTIALWKRPRSGGSAQPVSGVAAFQTVESPLGGELLYDANGPGIWRSLPDGSSPALVPELAHVWPRLNWTLGAGGVYLVDSNRDAESFWFYRFHDRQLIAIGKAEKPVLMDTPSLNVSPDARWLLYGQQEHVASDIKIRHGKLW